MLAGVLISVITCRAQAVQGSRPPFSPVSAVRSLPVGPYKPLDRQVSHHCPILAGPPIPIRFVDSTAIEVRIQLHLHLSEANGVEPGYNL
jgi:hypothetical protein